MPKSFPTPTWSRVASTRIVFSYLVSAGMLAMAFTCDTPAYGQKKKPGGHGAAGPGGGHAAGGAGGPGSGHGAGMGAPPGMGAPGMGGMGQPGMGRGGRGYPGMGGPLGGARKGGTKKATPKREPPETIDNESLPPGYTVPQEPPEALTTTAEWIEDPFQDKADSKKNYNAMNSRYRKILGDGEFKEGDKDKQLVTDFMKWKLSMLTRKEKRETAEEWREKNIKRDLQQYPERGNPKTVRRFLLKVVAEEAPRLFEYHAVARLNGAILLAELCDINETDAEGKTPA
ncbi:MAG TPA: hypothetical protein VGH74_18105, partial [Planctomycetaceae bacterium]